MTNHAREIRDGLETAPLRAVDEAVEAIAHAAGPGERRELLMLITAGILRHISIEAKLVTADPLFPLFDTHLPPSARAVVAAVLWRALDVVAFEPNDQHRIVDLLDSVYGAKSSRVYHDLGLTARDQAYKKLAALRDASAAFQDDLSAIVKGVLTLDQVTRARHGFMKLINSVVGQALVKPFLGELTDRSLLDRLFATVTAYVEAQPAELVPRRDEAIEILHAYAAKAEDIGTHYARTLARLPNRIVKAINDHFTISPATKPAHLTATAVNKKHLLSSVGAEVIIGITITNEGPGHAFDVYLTIEADSLVPDQTNHFLGSLPIGTRNVDIPCKVRAAAAQEAVYARITWRDFDNTAREIAALLELTAQRADIDWDRLATLDPYHLTPVENERELAGRDDVLNQLIAQVTGPSVGSSFIYGQRRVGKTSIVKTFKHHVANERPGLIVVLYLEAGEYVDQNGADTIKRLGRRLCTALRNADQRFAGLPIPTFEYALAPLTDFLEDALHVAPDLRAMFVLDEFDELPVELYRRSLSASPLFLTIRSISGKPQFGFVLVGGEKMSTIISNQGQQLNKFVPIRIDYFDRQRNWRSFVALVRRPVQDWIEITDDALEMLWAYTAGNPYFTRLVCRKLFELLVRRRDSHATAREVADAIDDAISSSAANAFQHFWDDGINEPSPAAAEETSLARRKVLLALGQLRREGKQATHAAIAAAAETFNLPPELTHRELQDFLRREVLVHDGSAYTCKVGLFERWLQERGQLDVMTTITDRDAALAFRSAEEKAYVTSSEIVNLARRWGPYQGNILSEDHVRMWLQQFGHNLPQRQIFHLLERVTFYSDTSVRKHMRVAHLQAVRELTWKIEEGERRRADILVNYVDGPSKRGAHYAKLYATENDILVSNVVSKAKLGSALGATHRAQALMIVDDFVGTGQSAIEHVRAIADDLRVVQATRPLKRIAYIAVSGFRDGISAIEEFISSTGLPISVSVCDVLEPQARCFDPQSTVYTTTTERDDAYQLVLMEGEKLLPQQPLGRGDCQATVVFETTCPANSLPILWAENPNWMPLFKQ